MPSLLPAHPAAQHAAAATPAPLQRIEDPIGLLPPKLILGINKRGVHFFRPVPKEYLHSAELRDIMQFGSSSQVRQRGQSGGREGAWAGTCMGFVRHTCAESIACT